MPVSSIDKACRNCGARTVQPFYRVQNVPVHSVLLVESRAEALNFPTGDIELAFCSTCGFVANTAFDAETMNYSDAYEETQGFSPTFQGFHRRLAEDLIERHDLREQTIIEIGCGKGEFLTLLCELGDNDGIGFDPAYIDARNTSPAKDRLTFITDFYSEAYAHYDSDFVCCKMTLEHIPDTAAFVETVRRSLGDRADTVVFFQVPEVRRILQEQAFWDIYYEHCSYFSRGSLARLFREQGFDVVDAWTDYDDQYLMIEARPGSAASTARQPHEDDLDDVRRDVETFAAEMPRRLQAWRGAIHSMTQDGRRIVLWGGGSKAVAFLTTLGIREDIDYAVDINPYKHGTFITGTGQEIIGPDALQAYRPDVVIIMNPIYRQEIKASLDRMGLTPDLIDVTVDPQTLACRDARSRVSTERSSTSSCPVCHATDVSVFIEIPQVPILCNVLWPSREGARSVTRGDLRLGFCQQCGHVYNDAFDPDLMEYAEAYENSLHCSPRFQQYATDLADRLIERYDLREKHIVEIGCGQGDFLKLLCDRGDNRGTGFDPSYASVDAIEADPRITIVKELYAEKHVDYDADFICCRHVLEHVPQPRAFMDMVRRAAGAGVHVFFEVPDVLATLRGLAIWDLIYEHCSYFSSASLGYLFEACGFRVHELSDAFDGQYLGVEAISRDRKKEAGKPPTVGEIAADVDTFTRRFEAKIADWRYRLQRIERQKQRAVVWGAGSKGITLLNLLDTRDRIDYVVDINTKKQGMYVAGAGQQIVAPAFLRTYEPDLVVVMNAIYEDEIRQQVRDLGLSPAFVLA